jgi:hypothetical protein
VSSANAQTAEHDIFISYSSKDRAWVEAFAKILVSRGWTVWWDRQIPTGDSFDIVIEQHLTTARCVIVVWSQHSVGSDWVKNEAAAARERKVLLPILIDDAKLPLEFKRIQTQFLQDWQDGSPHAGFDRLLHDIARLLGIQLVDVPQIQKPWWRQFHPIWLLSLPTVVAAVVVIALMQWPIAARIQVELTTERVEFTLSKTNETTLLGPITARAVAIANFETISFQPENIKVADPARYQMGKDDFPDSAWKPLSLQSATIAIVPKDATLHPIVSIEGPNRDGLPALQVDPVAMSEGVHVTLQTRGEKGTGVTIKAWGQKNFRLPMHETVRMTAQHTEVQGAVGPLFQKQELRYQIQLPKGAAWIDIAAQPDGLVISPTFSPAQSVELLSGLRVDALDFTRQGVSGQSESALSSNGKITFPDYPHLGTILISKDEAVGLERLDRFTIEKIGLTGNMAGLHLHGQGRVKQVRMKTGAIPIRYRLTAFDVLWHDPQLTTLLTVVFWGFPTTVGAYRQWKKLKR